MAFAATKSTSEPRAFSIGPYKVEFFTFTADNGDTAGTITAESLERVDHAILDGGLTYTAAPTFSDKTVTLAFADPGAGGAFGTAMLFGK